MSDKIEFRATYPETPSELEAMETIYHIASKGQVKKIIVCPDISPNKHIPVGVSVLSTELNPAYVGTDIGCGISVYEVLDEFPANYDFSTDHVINDLAYEFATYKIPPRCINKYKSEFNVQDDTFDHMLGTIGGGNHFCELTMAVQTSRDSDIVPGKFYIVVHSGSRDYGVVINDAYTNSFLPDTDTHKYICRHDDAVAWAKANRSLIAFKFSHLMGLAIKDTPISNVVHNFVERNKDGLYVHRKGAIPSDVSSHQVFIPGSRNDYSYFIDTADTHSSTVSLPHGAGRRISRQAAKELDLGDEPLKMRAPDRQLYKSIIISNRKEIDKSEHSKCYKNIDDIIRQLKEEIPGLRVLAQFIPRITIKL